MNNPAVHEVEVGTVVAETYTLVRVLGRGGMGTVWEATHKRLPGKQVAIKVLHAQVAQDADSLARFRREAEIACRLGHPNIVEVHDFNFLDNGCPYLILELLEGQDLEGRLRQGPLSIEECELILRQIGSALQSAHEQGVIHRDLKPQNIFLVPSPTGIGPDIAKVLDFGISKIQGSQTVQTQDATLLGTPQYMAPEQARGEHDKVDARTDLFALAAMFYELLSGKAAFAGKNIPEVVYKVVHAEPTPLASLCPDLAEHQIAAIAKALAKVQDERFSTIGEFVEAFTGAPLPKTRDRRVSSAPTLATAATMDSGNIPLGTAETFDSTNQPISAIAVAETLDSQNASMAIAETMDSQNAKLATQQTMLPTDSVQVVAETLDSQSGLPTPASTVPAQTLPLVPRSLLLRNILIVTVLCAFGVIAFLLTRSDAAKAPVATVIYDAAPRTPTPSDAGIRALVDAAVPPTFEPAQPIDASLRIDAPLKKTGSHKPIPATINTAPSNPPLFYELLKTAESAIRAGNGRAAANATGKAKRHGTSAKLNELDAKAFCLMLDLTRANGAIRRVKRSRKKAIRQFCKSHGLEISQ